MDPFLFSSSGKTNLNAVFSYLLLISLCKALFIQTKYMLVKILYRKNPILRHGLMSLLKSFLFSKRQEKIVKKIRLFTFRKVKLSLDGSDPDLHRSLMDSKETRSCTSKNAKMGPSLLVYTKRNRIKNIFMLNLVATNYYAYISPPGVCIFGFLKFTLMYILISTLEVRLFQHFRRYILAESLTIHYADIK